MSIDHNRIKVTDLETNQPNRILATNEKGEIQFSDIAAIKVDSYNGLDYTTEGKALDARQGKVLKDLVAQINLLLVSDNVNLNTVQKLVDAIEVVQTSLSGMLVNDLTTGGITKALTAEQGKVLQTNKVDKVAGKGLSTNDYTTAEQAKLAGITNIITTVKTIVSTLLPSQDLTGFVTYINTLGVTLVVGTNETVKYKTSDTGRVFELLLRGRSFGTGQPAITTANAIEMTEFLNKDLKLSNYPNTRNDGQMPTNKVLSTDANGNIKLYSIANAPSPYLDELTPDIFLPGTTGNVILKGSFFTPTMTVSLVGQTINYVKFISDNEFHINITTGSNEGNYNVTLNNEISTIFPAILFVSWGTLYKPVLSDWTDINGSIDLSEEGATKQTVANVSGEAKWKTIPASQNFRLMYDITVSPINSTLGIDNTFNHNCIALLNNRGDILYSAGVYSNDPGNPLTLLRYNGNVIQNANNYEFRSYQSWEIKRLSGVLYVYMGGVLILIFPNQPQVDMIIQARPKNIDIVKIKYVVLS